MLSRLIEELHHETPPAPAKQGGGGATIRPGTPWQRPAYPRLQTEPDRDPLVYEQPLITVTAELDGVRGSQTIEVTSKMDFVFVTDLTFENTSTVTVNILDLEI